MPCSSSRLLARDHRYCLPVNHGVHGELDSQMHLLADHSVRRDGQCVSRLVAVPRRCRVLNQPDVIREDISRDGSRRVFITRVLVVDAERHALTDGHIVERDLVSIRRNRLQRDSGEAAPARMDVSRADAADACLRRRRKIGSSCSGSKKNDADRRRHRLARGGRCVMASERCDAGRNRDREYCRPRATSTREGNRERYRLINGHGHTSGAERPWDLRRTEGLSSSNGSSKAVPLARGGLLFAGVCFRVATQRTSKI